jgi:hypothetical protein
MDRGFSRKKLQHFANASINEVLLHWFGRDHYASQVLLRTRKRRAPAPSDWKKFCGGNVVGIGFGAKESAGKPTGDLAVRIYVRKKHARSKLSASQCVPAVINGMPTDIVRLGTPAFHARPVMYGAGISHVDASLGTLGCVVTRPGTEERYILSACHVLVPDGVAHPGGQIVEPAMRNRQGDPPNPHALPIATLADFEPLIDNGAPNRMDAAIARLDSNDDVLAKIPLLDGAPTGPPAAAVPFQSVFKYGAATGRSLGVVMSASASITLNVESGARLFEDVIEVAGADGLFSKGGDSGALVVDPLSKRAIGLVIGGDGRHSFLTPLARVLNRFNVELLAYQANQS